MIEPASSRVIYGTDDRLEVYEEPDALLRDLAVRSVVALVFQNRVTIDAGGAVTRSTVPLSQALRVCDDERFSSEPTLAHCSGVLVDRDLVLTVGHCMGETLGDADRFCKGTLVAFGLAFRTGPLLDDASVSDLYACQKILVRSFDRDHPDVPDFAVLKLDRAVPDTTGVPVVLAPGSFDGQALTLVGNGSGLPTKIDSGGRTVNSTLQDDYFSATTDSFGGGSGSGIFDADRRLIGIQSRGQPDWTQLVTGGCFRAAQATVGSETHQYAHRAIEALCASGWPSDVLCGAMPRCGDGACSALEATGACPVDCAPSACGDGTCAPGERGQCLSDCEPVTSVPATWTCPPNDFRDGITCNCNCGRVDPDCELPGRPIAGCDWGERCDSQGRCVLVTPVTPSSPAYTPSGGCAMVSCASGGAPTKWAFLALALVWRRRRVHIGRSGIGSRPPPPEGSSTVAP